MQMVNIISRLSEEVVERHESPSWREAARATGGVPVYEDMSGVLVIGADGEPRHFDPEAKTVKPVTGKWRQIALVCASRLYRELVSMAPVKPRGARECFLCGGKGIQRENTICGECSGTGWVA